jgi:hypothetical protein
VVVQHVIGEVLDAGEHRGDPGRLTHDAQDQHPERPVAHGDSQLDPQRLLRLDDNPLRRVAGEPEDGDRTHDHEDRDEDAHRPVPLDAALKRAAVELVDQHGREGA